MRVYSGFKGLVEKTEENISIEFLMDVVKMFPIGYKIAPDNTYKKSDVGPYQARDLFPHMRRAVIDTKLQKLVNLHDGFESCTDKNVAYNCSHVRIKTNDIIITANAVQHPNQIVRYARFRETNAVDNRQLELFPREEKKNSDGVLYAMILHGSDENDLARTSFLYLAYPSEDLKGYLTLINLENFCDIKLYETAQEEKIQVEYDVKLKEAATKEAEENI